MKKSILCVDDDPAIRESLTRLLTDTGYHAIVVATGEEAVATIESTELDLVLLDLDLPGLTGWDVLDFARVRRPQVALVILTGFGRQCEPGAACQADAFLEKPPDIAVLLATIQRLLAEPIETRIRRFSQNTATRSGGTHLEWIAPPSIAPAGNYPPI